MPWPDLFWGKKPKPAPEAPPTFSPPPEAAKPQPQPPTIKPVPASAAPSPSGISAPLVVANPAQAPTPSRKIEMKPISTPMPTLPVTHGVVLRPPASLSGSTSASPTPTPQITPPRAINPAPSAKPATPLKNIEQLMAEADPVQTLRQTGNVRVLPPLTAENTLAKPIEPPAKNAASTGEMLPKESLAPAAKPVVPEPPAPSFKITSTSPEIRKVGDTGAPATAPLPTVAAAPTASEPIPPPAATPPVPPPLEGDSPFILKPAPVLPDAAPPTPAVAKILPPTAPLAPIPTPMGSIFRRKAKMNDVARIVLPPKREDTQQLLAAAPPPTSVPTPTVIPPAFPVAAMKVRATHMPAVTQPMSIARTTVPVNIPTLPVAEVTPVGADVAPAKIEPEHSEPPIPPTAEKIVLPHVEKSETKAEPAPVEKPVEFAPIIEKPVEAKIEANLEPTPIVETKPIDVKPFEEKPFEPRPVEFNRVEPFIATPEEPKVDPEAHKPPPGTVLEPLPKIDPEAHKPEPPPKPAEPVTTLDTVKPAPEKREFHLANGERVAGVVLSETPESVYLEHPTLGVLTVPRNNIAKRLVEIILINGDRIVGDIMAETADTLYVRHASLGMLTVPRAQRSTRVVEAILKDGDRILGEVLTETDEFTVIRSATLGTVTVPHTKLAMLNRKVEQIEMKALPPALPELKDKVGE